MGLIEWEVQRSMPFNFRLRGNHRVDSMVKSVAQHLDFGRKNHQQKFNYLNCLLANLRVSWETKKYIGISMDSNYYSKIPERYRTGIESYRTVRNVIDGMVNAGFIEFEKGYKNLNTGKGHISKIKPTDSFGLSLPAIGLDTFEEMRPQEVIILRDENKNDRDYVESDSIKEMRIDLNVYNELRSKSKINIKNIPYKVLSINLNEIKLYSKTRLQLIDKNEPIVIELKPTFLVRIFNNNSFRFGGRFYRGVESGLPEQVREYICINEHETIELDYSGLHLRMAYNMGGLKLNGDPYKISTNQPVHMRSFYKKISLIMINAENETNAYKGIVNEYRGTEYQKFIPNLKHKTLKQYCDAFKEAHKAISNRFYTGLGIFLQNIDSAISNRILMHFARKDILVLCIHDSYIIDSRYKDELKEVMEREYLTEFPDLPPIID